MTGESPGWVNVDADTHPTDPAGDLIHDPGCWWCQQAVDPRLLAQVAGGGGSHG